MKRIILLSGLLMWTIVGTTQSSPEGLFIGSKAPEFRAKDQQGQEVRLKDLLKKGKVVIIFYRGQWCPYCNKELQKLQDSLQAIKGKGATLIAVTPEKPESILKTIEKTKASFPIIFDEDLKIMKAYDVVYEVPENMISRYRSAGIDIEENNGKNGKFLPVPAVYVIDKEATVVYRFFEPDYKKQANINDILKNL
jgi:peroxiredoxin